MGFQHVRGQGLINGRVAVVQRDAQPVRGQVGQGFVHRQAVEDQSVAEGVISGGPIAAQIVAVDGQTAGAEGEVVVVDRVYFVGAGQDG